MEGPRRLVRVLRATAALLVGLGVVFYLSKSPAGPSAPEPLVQAVESVRISVADLDRSAEFYTRLLFFEKISETRTHGSTDAHVARLKLGDEVIELTEGPGLAQGPSAGSGVLGIVVSDIDQVYLWLRRHKVASLSSLRGRPGGIRSVSFKDLDGYRLEVWQFARGEGEPRWQGRHDRVFLGIDHAALRVADTEASLRFYRDALGMRVVGEREGSGRLRVTTVRAAQGPAIELVEAPSRGVERSALDWRPVLVVQESGERGPRLVLLRDPDGQALEVRQGAP